MTHPDIFMFIYGCVISYIFGALCAFAHVELTRLELLDLMNEYKEKLNKLKE
jgi:hypothetical protein